MPLIIIFALSILLAWLVVFLRRKTDELSHNFFGWFFLLLFAYQTLAASPYVLYIFRFHADWSFSYFVAPENFPVITTRSLVISGLLVLLGYVVLIISYGYSRLTVLSGHTIMFQLPGILSFLALTAGGALYYERLWHISDFSDFWDGGGGTLLYLSPVSWTFLWVIILFVLTMLLSLKLK